MCSYVPTQLNEANEKDFPLLPVVGTDPNRFEVPCAKAQSYQKVSLDSFNITVGPVEKLDDGTFRVTVFGSGTLDRHDGATTGEGRGATQAKAQELAERNARSKLTDLLMAQFVRAAMKQIGVDVP